MGKYHQKVRRDRTEDLVKIVSYTFITLLSVLCLIPFLLMIATSLTRESLVVQYGFTIWPKEFSLNAYEIIIRNPSQIVGSYVVTILLTLIGTTIGLALIAMTGYALSRPDIECRNKISFLIYLTMLFSVGMVH